MKKWKLMVLTAALSAMVGTQALAAKAPELEEGTATETEATEAVKETEVSEAVKASETPEAVKEAVEQTESTPAEEANPSDTPGGESGTSVHPDELVGGGTAVCSDGTEVTWKAGSYANLCSSSRTISQEEAQKIVGTNGACKVLYIADIAVDFNGIYPQESEDTLKGKTVTGIKLTNGRLVFEIMGRGDLSNILIEQFGKDEEYAKETLTLVYFPSASGAFTKVEITSVDLRDGRIYAGGFTETLSPSGASVALIFSDNSPAETSGSSDRSEPPEVYSHGASVGGVGVQKSGVAARVVNAKGEEIQTIVHPYVAAGTKSLTQAQAQSLLGTKFACSIYSFDLSIVDAAGDYSQVTLKEGNVPVTFLVPGVTPESKVALRHWINGGSTYEDLPVEVGNGAVTARFTSFSPVVIVVEQPGVAASAASGVPVSPRTGESPAVYLAEVAALLSLIGLFLCQRKRQA